MASLPNVSIYTKAGSSLYYRSKDDEGDLCNAYLPLQNLENEETNLLTDFTTEKLNFDLKHPVEIIPQDAYDGAVNLVLNDGKNPIRLVNSRMSVRDDKYYIPDHTGYKDTNIYEEANFFQDTLLKNINKNLIEVEFGKTFYDDNQQEQHLPGIQNNAGSLKCGSYNFYFKLSDADGNETETIAESGLVQLHIGELCNPTSTRMGQNDEVTGKAVRFTLSNIDKGFEYVHVFYARHSSADNAAFSTEYSKVNFDFPVVFLDDISGQCDVFITGHEGVVPCEKKEIIEDYADINNAQTVAVYNKMLVAGNVSEPVIDYNELRNMSWRIKVDWSTNKNIGDIDFQYLPSVEDVPEKLGYYNTDNIYYKVGYWPDEIYRFGIVYIFNDNSLSPVFNITGVDFNKQSHLFKKDLFINGISRSFEPEDMWFNKEIRLNSRGVVKFPKQQLYNADDTGLIQYASMNVNFDLSNIGSEFDVDQMQATDLKNLTMREKFDQMNIKGYFFVRQKRIPTILGQGLAIGLTKKEYGSIPVIKNGNNYSTVSFLDDHRMLNQEGRVISINDNQKCYVRALLVPDFEVNQEVYNSLFSGTEYALCPVVDSTLTYHKSVNTACVTKTKQINKHSIKASLTSIPLNTSVRTDGKTYFSTVVGTAQECTKTKDVNNEWSKTVPQTLTNSTSLIRGEWGVYVGVTPSNDYNSLSYGTIYNIKNANYDADEDAATDLDFISRMNNNNSYFCISDRINKESVNCYRGDCFPSLYTHRMMWNFQDPETPNNHQIIDPSTWRCNYGVKCSAFITDKAKINIKKEDQGWFINPSETNGTGISLGNTRYIQNYKDYLCGFQDRAALNDDFKKALKDELDYIETNHLENLIATCNYPVINIKYPSGTSFVDINVQTRDNEIIQLNEFGFLNFQDWLRQNMSLDEGLQLYANKVCEAWEIYVGSSVDAIKNRKEVVPEELEQEQGKAVSLKRLFRNTTNYELHGIASINRSDVNAVGLGQWVTFPVLSSRNLAMRDVEYGYAAEETIHGHKRGFYPLMPKDQLVNIPDSYVCNTAASISIPDREYIGMPNVPFIKQEYITRIYNSLIQTDKTFQNAWKSINEFSYKDYTKIYGSITKIVPYGDKLIIVFKHGIGVTALNDAAQNKNDYLSAGIGMISEDIGSIWKDSILFTGNAIYGVDTVAKKIWQYSSSGLRTISDNLLQEFLNDNCNLSEFTIEPLIGHVNVKTHYNNYKHDVIFTFINDENLTVTQPTEEESEEYVYNTQYGARRSRAEVTKVKSYEKGKRWSLCYNEMTQTFVTRYDWYPLESANIDNIYFSFDLDAANDLHQQQPKSTQLEGLSVISQSVYDQIDTFGKVTLNKTTLPETGLVGVGLYDSDTQTFSSTLPQTVTFYDPLPKGVEANMEVRLIAQSQLTPTSPLERTRMIGNIRILGDGSSTYIFDLQDFALSLIMHDTTTVKTIVDIQIININTNIPPVLSTYELPDNQYVENKHHIDQAFQSNTEISFLNADFIFNKKVKSFTFGKQLPFRINSWPALKATDLYILSFYAKTNCSFPNQDTKWLDLTLEMDGNANIRQDKNSFKVFNKWHFYTVIFNFNKKNNPGSCDYRILTPTEWQYNNYTEPNCTPTLYFSEVKMTPIFEDNKLYDLYRLSTESITIAQYQSEDYVTSDNVTKTALRRLYDLRNNDNFLPLWKHGQAGAYDNQEPIKPTNWYGKQHDWFFEFVAKENPGVQQIFNNLKIISNNVAPHSFEYEVVGDSYDWKEYKPLILWLNKKAKEDMLLSPQPKAFEDYLKNRYHEVLDKGYQQMRADYLAEDFPVLFREVIPAKLPFIAMELDEVTQYSLPSDPQADKHKAQNRVLEYKDNTTQPILVQDRIFNEQRLHTEQYGNDIKKFGRVRGNMQYLEDLWDVEIRPIRFKYVYVDKMNGNILKDFYSEESRLRDKYLKIKIKYTGEDLAIVSHIITSLNYSYA